MLLWYTVVYPQLARAHFTKTYSNNLNGVDDRAYAIEPTPDGGYVMAGTTEWTALGQTIPYIVKTDQNGAFQWSRRFTRITPAADSAGFHDIDIVTDSQGNHVGYIVTGFIQNVGQGDLDILTLRLDLQGNVLWQRFYQSPWSRDGRRYDDEGWSVEQRTDGGFVITGYANGDTTVCDYFPQVPSVVSYHRADLFLLRIDALGNTESWTTLNDYPAGYQYPLRHFRDTKGYSVQETSDGGFITVGYRRTSFLFGMNENPCWVPGANNYRTFMAKFDQNGNYLWSRIIPDPGGTDDIAFDVRETSNGGFIVAGFTDRSNGRKMYVLKTDAWGQLSGAGTWSRVYSRAASNTFDCAYSIRELSTGGYILTGYSSSLTPQALCVLRLSANGALIWAQLHGGANTDIGRAIRIVDNGRNFVATGVTNSFGTGDDDIILVKGAIDCDFCGTNVAFTQVNPQAIHNVHNVGTDHLMDAQHILDVNNVGTIEAQSCGASTCDINNQRVFQVHRSRFERERGQEGMQTSDGGYAITGFDLKGSTGSLAMLIKTDNAGSTAFKWSYEYKPENTWTYGYSVQEITGSTPGYAFAGDIEHGFAGTAQLEYNMLLVNTDANGIVQWGRSFGLRTGDNTSHDHGRSLDLTSDGGYAIAGYSNSIYSSAGSYPGGYNIYVVKTDNGGNITPVSSSRWAYVYGGNGNDYAESIQQTSDGGYIIAGYSSGGGANGEDINIMKLNSDGSVAWAKLIGTSDNERAYSVQQTSDGGYILSGYQVRSGDTDALVLKLNASGALLWARRYTVNGSVDDRAMSIKETPTAPNGGYIIGGWTQTTSEATQGYMLKIDACGEVEWSYAAPDVNPMGPGVEAQEDHFESVALVDDGGYFFVGSTCSYDPHTTKGDLWDVKTRCDGHVCQEEDITSAIDYPNLNVQTFSPSRFEAAEQLNITVLQEGGAGTGYICQEQGISSPKTFGSEHDNTMLSNDTYPQLLPNNPNPFSEQTTIQYYLPVKSYVRLKVMDLQGRVVAQLVDGFSSAGLHSVVFNAETLPSGTYMYQMETPQQTITQLMRVVK